jgi:hypothetical protein
MAAEQGEEHRGGRRDAPSNAYHPGALVGRHPDHGDVVERGPGSGDALAVGRPPTTPGYLGETDAQAERHAVAGEGEDLVADHGVRHVPGAVEGVGQVAQLERHPDGEGAGVPRWPVFSDEL